MLYFYDQAKLDKKTSMIKFNKGYILKKLQVYSNVIYKVRQYKEIPVKILHFLKPQGTVL